MDLLLQIKDDVMKYAETISQILNIDVEVMDSNLIRITGTGRIKEKVGLNMSEESHIYKEVLKTKETYIITDPWKEEICKSCPSRGTWGEVLEISTPIVFENKAIGVIGLICFDEFQKREFLYKKESYIKFLKQMASFISSRVYQENEKFIIQNNNKSLSNIIDRIPNAIIITNEYNKIEVINDMGIMLFGEKNSEQVIKAKNINDFLNKKEFQLTYNNVTRNVIGDIFNFSGSLGRFKTLYVFQDAEEFKKYIFKFNKTYSDIFIFNSPQMQDIYSKVQRVAKTITTIKAEQEKKSLLKQYMKTVLEQINLLSL